ncbi:MAG: SIS domain-containing protein [Propionibacteriaceae bacterium]|jgi:arabinose-5-phosphate isomerase|nr:SIS domain-containing protein [Propionibacteriaceae bacterium]
MNQEFLDLATERIAIEAGGIQAVAGVFDEATDEIVALLYGCSGKVFVTGSGTSGTIARRMAHLFSVSGTPSVYMQPSDALHGTMGALVEGDVLIAISKGGGSDEINDLCARAKERGVKIVALTSERGSVLASLADHVQIFEVGDQVDPGNLIAMGSTLMHAVWGDCLAVALMRMRGYTWSEVVFTHPLGAVGKMGELPDAMGTLSAPRSGQ